ncbi:MAG: glycoside hydrolase family 18 protein [Terracidiphilus sp.]
MSNHMTVNRFSVLGLILAVSVCGLSAPISWSQQPIVVGYVFPQSAVLQPGQIDPHRLDRINYAFANIVDGRMVAGFANDAENLALLTDLKRENPSLTVLVSVGGWLGSNHFSDVALTGQSRRVFIQSVMDFLNLHHLDGLDVDWEYPGLAGAGNVFRVEDKRNFTSLLKEVRERFDEESARTRKRLYLTIAAGSDTEYLDHTEMAKLQRYVDTVNLMTYDYYEAGSDAITGNHAPLFVDPADPKKASADTSVHAFEQAGVPAAKILLGVPFYGRQWGQVKNVNHGLFQPGKAAPGSYASYDSITENMLNNGYSRYWDSNSSVPYLFNKDNGVFVSYEDPESLSAKCNYVLTHKLGGVMFWEYRNDASGQLLKAIDLLLRKESAGTNGK